MSQVNVIYGCNERCTYCVVPNTRGEEQSREPDAILVRRSNGEVILGRACGLRVQTALLTALVDLCSTERPGYGIISVVLA
jgi:pyruvate-formate lyase-activating enzyme